MISRDSGDGDELDAVAVVVAIAVAAVAVVTMEEAETTEGTNLRSLLEAVGCGINREAGRTISSGRPRSFNSTNKNTNKCRSTITGIQNCCVPGECDRFKGDSTEDGVA